MSQGTAQARIDAPPANKKQVQPTKIDQQTVSMEKT
jgi:hypothetical protein